MALYCYVKNNAPYVTENSGRLLLKSKKMHLEIIPELIRLCEMCL